MHRTSWIYSYALLRALVGKETALTIILVFYAAQAHAAEVPQNSKSDANGSANKLVASLAGALLESSLKISRVLHVGRYVTELGHSSYPARSLRRGLTYSRSFKYERLDSHRVCSSCSVRCKGEVQQGEPPFGRRHTSINAALAGFVATFRPTPAFAETNADEVNVGDAHFDIQIIGSPILRQRANEVTNFDVELQQLSQQMLEVVRAERTFEQFVVGLAAPQVGRAERVFVLDLPTDAFYNLPQPMPTVFVNPRIVSRSKEVQRRSETCFSVPGISAVVERSYAVSVEFMDVEGNSQRLETKGFLARLIQHELDHLDGILFIDRLPPEQKARLEAKALTFHADTANA